jgi:hypothetical protein
MAWQILLISGILTVILGIAVISVQTPVQFKEDVCRAYGYQGYDFGGNTVSLWCYKEVKYCVNENCIEKRETNFLTDDQVQYYNSFGKPLVGNLVKQGGD